MNEQHKTSRRFKRFKFKRDAPIVASRNTDHTQCSNTSRFPCLRYQRYTCTPSRRFNSAGSRLESPKGSYQGLLASGQASRCPRDLQLRFCCSFVNACVNPGPASGSAGRTGYRSQLSGSYALQSSVHKVAVPRVPSALLIHTEDS